MQDYLIVILVFVPLLVGMMFVPINNFYGVRCSWTLKSPKVWDIVHKYTGYTVSLIVVSVVGATFSGDIGTVYAYVSSIAGLCIFPLIFSYIAYKKLNGDLNFSNGVVKFLTSDILSGMLILLAFFLAVYCINCQEAMMAKFGNSKIASHFNAKGVADGWMKSMALYDYFYEKQMMIFGVLALCSFGLISFTKSLLGRGLKEKIIVALLGVSFGFLSISLYYLCVFLSVEQAQTSKKFDMFATVPFSAMAAGFSVAVIIMPMLIMFRAMARIEDK